MERTTSPRRGVALLALAILVAGGLAASSVGAAAPVTKAKVRKIAGKVVTQRTPGILQQANAESIDNIVYYRRSPKVTVPAGGEAGNAVACPAGTLAVGGGFVGQTRLDNPSSSYPSNGTAFETGFTGWRGFMSNFSGAPHDFRVYVVCLKADAMDSDYAAGLHPLT